MIIVSDAMPTVGGGSGYELYGKQIKLIDNTLVNSEGRLAGAHITIGESIDFLVSEVGLELEECLRMAITHPALLMHQPHLQTIINQPLSQCVVFGERAASATPLQVDMPPATDHH